MDKGWRDILGAVAPALATAMSGPLVGLAVRELSQVLLGHENGSEADLSAAMVGASGDQLVRVREAGIAFDQRMRELDIDLERIAAGDRDSARQREGKTGDTVTPRLIAFGVLCGFLGSVWWVLSGQVKGLTDPAIMGVVGTLIGYVSATADQVVSYYFGSSASSATKTAAMVDAMARGSK